MTNWIPIRRGTIYCASACGGDCTFAAYQRARRQATTLAKKLGQGWTIQVWENLGWFYAVVSPDKTLTIHPRHRGATTSYFCSIDVPGVGQMATVNGTDLFECFSNLSHQVHQNVRAFDAAVASLKSLHAFKFPTMTAEEPV